MLSDADFMYLSSRIWWKGEGSDYCTESHRFVSTRLFRFIESLVCIVDQPVDRQVVLRDGCCYSAAYCYRRSGCFISESKIFNI